MASLSDDSVLIDQRVVREEYPRESRPSTPEHVKTGHVKGCGLRTAYIPQHNSAQHKFSLSRFSCNVSFIWYYDTIKIEVYGFW